MKDLKELLKENLEKNKSGTYILILKLPQNRTLKVGKLGKFTFEQGTYFYVGRAKGGFGKRVIRYFKKRINKKWHIDYLLEYANPLGIFFFDEFYGEEDIAKKMEALYLPVIRGFGATDTHSKTHLFYKKR